MPKRSRVDASFTDRQMNHAKRSLVGEIEQALSKFMESVAAPSAFAELKAHVKKRLPNLFSKVESFYVRDGDEESEVGEEVHVFDDDDDDDDPDEYDEDADESDGSTVYDEEESEVESDTEDDDEDEDDEDEDDEDEDVEPKEKKVRFEEVPSFDDCFTQLEGLSDF